MKKYLLNTKDGTKTLVFEQNGTEKREAMHDRNGALSEAIFKFIKPCVWVIFLYKNIKILDLCSGLGYNTVAALKYFWENSKYYRSIRIDLVEKDREILDISRKIDLPNHFNNYKPFHELYKEYAANFLFSERKESKHKNICLNFYIGDARDMVKELEGGYDMVLFDAFSPTFSPELYTVEFFQLIKNKMNETGFLITYSSSSPMRSSLIEAGFKSIGETRPWARRRGGTIASPSTYSFNISLRDELMIALTDLGIPFRDPNLRDDSSVILKRREKERKELRNNILFPSSKNTPFYLLYEDKIPSKVLKTLNNFGLKPNDSNAKYLICPVKKECICGRCDVRLKNSVERILEMRKRILSLNRKE
ncbi:MAG: MnmC family methyltransferase [Candidatus Hydrothermarchaeota archaeon]